MATSQQLNLFLSLYPLRYTSFLPANPIVSGNKKTSPLTLPGEKHHYPIEREREEEKQEEEGWKERGWIQRAMQDKREGGERLWMTCTISSSLFLGHFSTFISVVLHSDFYR